MGPVQKQILSEDFITYMHSSRLKGKLKGSAHNALRRKRYKGEIGIYDFRLCFGANRLMKKLKISEKRLLNI